MLLLVYLLATFATARSTAQTPTIESDENGNLVVSMPQGATLSVQELDGEGNQIGGECLLSVDRSLDSTNLWIK